MADLIEFIRARLDEDDQTARAARGREWHVREGSVMDGGGVVATGLQGDLDDAEAAHIARHDPATVLRNVAVKRRLLEIWEPNAHCQPMIRIAASVWSDHPDYRQEWAP